MLHPLIYVPNRVRHGSGSVLHKVHGNAFVSGQNATWFAEHGNEKCRLPVVSAHGGSGASAADAIFVDSDQDISGVSTLSRTDMPKLPIIHGASLNQDVIDSPDSDIELLSAVRSENKVEEDPETPYHSPLPLARESSADISDMMPSDPPPRCALTKEEGVALSGHPSDGNFEADGADKKVDSAEDMDGNRRHVKPPCLPPSLQPIRKLLAGRIRRGDPERDRTIVAPGISKKRGRKEFLKEAPAFTSSESEEELSYPASDPQLKRVPLPKTDHGRPRRLLMPESADLPLVAVTMRGDCHFIERKKK